MNSYVDDSFCKAHMKQGERILWKCRPAKGHLFRKGDWLLLILLALSAAYVAFECSCLPETDFFRTENSEFLRLIRFFGVNCCLLCGAYAAYRLIYRPLVRTVTRYVITDRQVICKGPWKVRTMDLKDPLPIYSHFFSDGNGIISFGMNSLLPIVHWNGARSMIPIFGHFELENIPHAEQVLNLICGIIEELNAENEESESDI